MMTRLFSVQVVGLILYSLLLASGDVMADAEVMEESQQHEYDPKTCRGTSLHPKR
jgi:hypothetical protein